AGQALRYGSGRALPDGGFSWREGGGRHRARGPVGIARPDTAVRHREGFGPLDNRPRRHGQEWPPFDPGHIQEGREGDAAGDGRGPRELRRSADTAVARWKHRWHDATLPPHGSDVLAAPQACFPPGGNRGETTGVEVATLRS